MKRQLDDSIAAAREWLLAQQHAEGYWCADLGCDASVTAEGLFLRHLLGRVDAEKQALTVRWLLNQQNIDGSWSIFYGGPGEVNVTVKCYLALKLAGLDPEEPAMRRAREAAVRMGGIESCHLFTHIYLAWGGLFPWERVARVPIEILSLPKWLFSRYDLSYWARTIVVPLFITMVHRPVFKLPCDLADLYTGNPITVPEVPGLPAWQDGLIAFIEKLLAIYDRFPIKSLRRKAIKEAESWFLERFQMSDGLGAIWPSMVNAAVALVCEGYDRESPELKEAFKQLDSLDVVNSQGAWTQPCVSPVWDTVWAMKALVWSGVETDNGSLERAGRWLLDKQSLIKADWAENTEGDVPAGGWYFQHLNAYYPDVDDTAVALMALRHLPMAGEPEVGRQMDLGVAWIKGMQNKDGGWGAFDRTPRKRDWLNLFSFARPFLGALQDPSTADVSARCLEAYGKLGLTNVETVQKGIDYLRKEQEIDGSWYGRWGVNYVYGTWSVLCALQACGVPNTDPMVRKAVQYLKYTQLPDGGWGETCETYADPSTRGRGPSTPSQTAWGVMGLVAAGEAECEEAERGVRYLLETQGQDGAWIEPDYTGTGFPNVFYLQYGMYPQFFPLLALGRYRASVRRTEAAQVVRA